MGKNLKYVSGNFIGNFFTNQKSALSNGEKIPDGELHHVHIYRGDLTDIEELKEFKPEEHLNRDGMLLHNVTNIQVCPSLTSVQKEKTIYDFEEFVLKNVKVESSWEQNGKTYGIADCLVVEQGPNYALAKRIQQWRAILARHQGQRVSINIAPSTTTHSVTKNPLLKAAFNGAELFDVEAFSPETTNAIMAALWIHDLRNESSVANPETVLDHPLELVMEGANHGGLWRVAYLARTALPFAAIYGFATEKLPFRKSSKK